MCSLLLFYYYYLSFIYAIILKAKEHKDCDKLPCCHVNNNNKNTKSKNNILDFDHYFSKITGYNNAFI